MKKFFLLIFIGFIFLNSGLIAKAEEIILTDDPMLKSFPDFPEKDEEKMTKSITSVSDLVEISDEGYGILTREGLAIGYTLSDDFVYVFTQDLVHQLDLYLTFYDNPIPVILSYVYNGVHLNIFDPTNQIDIYVIISEADWASLYPESNNLSESDVEKLLSFFSKNGFQNAKDSAYAKVGGNYWLIFDCSDTEGLVYMYTSVGGHQIQVCYEAKKNKEVQIGLKLINQLDIIQYK